jgi:hypothetical protein
MKCLSVKQNLHFESVRNEKVERVTYRFAVSVSLSVRPSARVSQFEKGSTNFTKGFYVLTAGVVKGSTYWHITSCSPMKGNLRLGGTHRLFLQVEE